jgi:hypothetical protein
MKINTYSYVGNKNDIIYGVGELSLASDRYVNNYTVEITEDALFELVKSTGGNRQDVYFRLYALGQNQTYLKSIDPDIKEIYGEIVAISNP